VLAVSVPILPGLGAQSPEMQQRIAELQDSMVVNRLLLAQYKWMEQDVFSVNGEEKKEELYQVQLGPDGNSQKIPVDTGAVSDADRQQFGIRGRIRERKIEEYAEYGRDITSLVQSYIPPEKAMLQQAYQKGNVMIGTMEGSPGQYRVVVSNFVKHGDNMTLVMDRAQKALVRLSISTYLSNAKDAVTVSAQFSAVPGGPNHAASQTIHGVSKKLTISIRNFNYQHM
jgi:hypothetical protein